MSAQSSRNQEFTSLLFTPRTGEQQGLPDYRSPRPNRSPSVHGYGRAKSYAEGATPRSRRSLTPPGSIKDTTMQQAPPSQSLADNLAAPPAASLPEPSGAEASALYTRDQQGRTVSRLSAQHLEDEDVWVTVYGFQPSQRHLIMKEFSKCGDILKFGDGQEDGSNWVHIQFANKYGAQRALQRNAELVSRQLMVGVQLLDARMRTLAHSAAPSASAGGASASSALSAQSSAQQLRPHRIQAAHTQGHIPQSTQSTLAKVKEFVFGL